MMIIIPLGKKISQKSFLKSIRILFALTVVSSLVMGPVFLSSPVFADEITETDAVVETVVEESTPSPVEIESIEILAEVVEEIIPDEVMEEELAPVETEEFVIDESNINTSEDEEIIEEEEITPEVEDVADAIEPVEIEVTQESSGSTGPAMVTLVSPWTLNDDGSAISTQNVQIDTFYKAPQNEAVTITFTSLPDESGTITVREVKLSAEDQEELGAISDTAYEVTSTMENGTFEYDLTLPLPANSINENVGVKYADSEDELDEAKNVEQTKEKVQNIITIRDLNHFTVFVLVNSEDVDEESLDDGNELVLSAIKDSYIEADKDEDNFGDKKELHVRSRNPDNQENPRDWRTLIQFSLLAIPDNSDVESAFLRLFMESKPSNVARTYELYRVTSPWNELDGGQILGVRWNNQPSLALEYSTSIGTPTQNGKWIELDVTEDIEAFLNNTYQNYGWLLRDGLESDSATFDGQFSSSEDEQTDRRPQLKVSLSGEVEPINTTPSIPEACVGIEFTNFIDVAISGGTGTNDNDFIFFTGENNFQSIDGKNGDDCILVGDNNIGEVDGGGDSNVIIIGNNNQGDILGGNNSDTIIIGDDNEGEIDGNGGDNTITVGDNNGNGISAGNGDDFVTIGGDNHGEIDIGGGDNILEIGDANKDEIFAGNGDDTITVGNNNEGDVDGSGGDNLIEIGSNNKGVVSVGNGDDKVIIADQNIGSIDLNGGDDEIQVGEYNFGNISGGNGNDTAILGYGSVIIDGDVENVIFLPGSPLAESAPGFLGELQISLSSDGADSIYYTTDGTTPNCSTSTLFESQVSIFLTKTINVIGCLDEGYSSPISTFTYTITKVVVTPSDFSTLVTENIFVPQPASSSAPAKVIVAQNIEIKIASSSVNRVTLKEGTKISRLDNQDLQANDLSFNEVTTSSFTVKSGSVTRGVLQWGLEDVTLEFTQPIDIDIFVGTEFDGQTLDIFRSRDGISWETDGLVEPACFVTGGICSFQAVKASYYAAVTPPPAEEGSSSGGGGVVGLQFLGNPTPTPSPIPTPELLNSPTPTPVPTQLEPEVIAFDQNTDGDNLGEESEDQPTSEQGEVLASPQVSGVAAINQVADFFNAQIIKILIAVLVILVIGYVVFNLIRRKPDLED
ncbi:MAG: DNRLRE domain-containing protein [Candidatus Paceibacterota bacterium]